MNFLLLRRIFSFPAMLMVFLMALVWILCSAKLNDPDIWWHLRHAQDLLRSHAVPTRDIYSFTVEGRERVNHEWLASIPYYYAWRIGGLVGIHVLRLLLAELIT